MEQIFNVTPPAIVILSPQSIQTMDRQRLQQVSEMLDFLGQGS